MQGVWGFLLATFVWFAVPSTIGTTTGLTYLALTADNASLALPVADIDAGMLIDLREKERERERESVCVNTYKGETVS